MKPMNDEAFLELAHKVAAGIATSEEAEQVRLSASTSPERAALLARLHSQASLAKDILRLINATEATEPRLPEHLRRRLQDRLTAAKNGEHLRDGKSAGPKVIDAEVVPGRSINGYKLGFYALLLLVLIVGCVVLLKSCSPTKETPQQGQRTPTVSTPQQPVETAQTPRVTPEASKPATPSKLRSYLGSKWTKLADSNVKPGNNLYFRQFVGPNLNSPIIEGMRAPNGSVPKDFMLFWRQGDSWELRSYPSVVTEAQTVVALDPSTILVADPGFSKGAYLIENGQALEIQVPGALNCISAHRDTKGTVYLHDAGGAVFRFSNGSGSWMDVTDPKAYIHDHGSPTEMRRGSIHHVARADSGETVGVFYRIPTALGPASLVRFNGELWEIVCSLGEKYPGPVTHFLSGDSMVAALGKQFLVVKGGVPRTLGLPDDVEAAGGAKWKGIRAASTEEFIAVETTGAVYHYANGRFDRQVERDPMLLKDGAWQGDGEGGLRSVLITPDGTIYAIQTPTRWSKSVLYQLVPQ